MASGIGEATSRGVPQSSSSSNGSDAGDFECNICFDLAQDPIVTLCGHLFCWPCLYRWLHIHSRSSECPVCKALVEEEKLVPLYGRGKSSTDPRSKSIPGVEIPHRPTGQRPETAPPPQANAFPQHDFGFGNGFAPGGVARMGNFALSAAFGGLVPSLFGNFALSAAFGGLMPAFNIQVNGFPDATVYGAAAGHPYGYPNTFHGVHAHGVHSHRFSHRSIQQQQADTALKVLCLVIGFFVFLALIWN
nr:E3 ubiquitin-protein ligase RNF185-like [Ipomoea batatas]